MLQFVNRVVGNPIHAYKMMKRFAIDWKRIEKSLEDDDWEGKLWNKEFMIQNVSKVMKYKIHFFGDLNKERSSILQR